MVKHVFMVAFELSSDAAAGAQKAYLELAGSSDAAVRLISLRGSTNGGIWDARIRNGLVAAGGTAPTNANIDYGKTRCLDAPGVSPRGALRLFNSASGKTPGGTDGATIKTICTAPLAPGLDIVEDAIVDAGGFMILPTEGLELVSFSNSNTLVGEMVWVEDWGGN